MLNSWSISIFILCLTSSALAYPASSLSQAQTNPGCLQGWSYFAKSNKCLKVFGAKPPGDPPMTWSKAEEYCNRFNGGHLVIIKSDDEITFVVEMTRATGYDDGEDGRIFIGFFFNNVSGWSYPDGTEATYFRWWPGQGFENDIYGKYPSGELLTRRISTGYIWVNAKPEGNSVALPFVCQVAPSSEGRK